MDQFSKATATGLKQAMNMEQPKSAHRKISAPFSYFGSKNKIATQLVTELPPHHCWVEAFCGSAALSLAKPPAPIEVINDIDGEIVNLFKQLRNNQNELCRLIALTPYAKKELHDARHSGENDSELERARKFLVQAMMAINGIFGKDKGGFSYSQSYSRNGKDARVNRWYNLPERLTNVVERLRNMRIENRDAIKLINMFINRPATLIYLDPPYLAKRTNGYSRDINNEAYHINMLRLVNKAKCMIFISGYENKLYDKLLSKKGGWKRKIIIASTRCTKGVDRARSEVVWMNKYFQRALNTGKVPIALTTKELKQNKLNPER